MSAFAESIFLQKYSWDRKETWADTAHRVSSTVMGAINVSPGDVRAVEHFITERKFVPGGRYLAMAGRELHQINNCFLLRAGDSREEWAELLQRVVMILSLGGGVGIDYSEVRPRGSLIRKTGGEASGPTALMQMVNEVGRHVMAGGSRRSAIWAGLSWKHPDIQEFIHLKDWPEWLRSAKETDFNAPAPMDMTNISVILDDEFFVAHGDSRHSLHSVAREAYEDTMRRMVKTAEPGFSIDSGLNTGESLRNPCTEITSRDDSDVCNLGSINLAKVESERELEEITQYATLFLLAGTIYSDVPYDYVKQVRSKNRRLGLGVMGLHEWLLQRGKQYGPDEELGKWLSIYGESTKFAHNWADKFGLSRPIKTRAIAPTGTIGIVAETTTGVEPIFCAAYQRRYLAGGREWKWQFVIDPTAKRLIDQGLNVDDVEDAYSLADDVERRVEFQHWVQGYVDHGISSTINLPRPLNKEETAEFGEMLFPYLKGLRGVTVYPDGARGGQPLTKVPLEIALEHEGVVFEKEEDLACIGGSCGI